MFSDLPADHIIQSHHVRGVTSSPSTKTTSFPSKPLQKSVYNVKDSDPLPPTHVVQKPFTYHALEMKYEGPKPPTVTELSTNKYILHIFE